MGFPPRYRQVACTLVNSRLDYANSVLFGVADANITKLQRTQNSLARVVSYTRRTEHIQPILQSLHWLPIKYRIDYKIATMAYKVRTTGSPAYLKCCVRNYIPTRQLRSSNYVLLDKGSTRTVIARRAFSYAAPTIWNSLPHDTRNAATFIQFRSSLRTHLYRLAFQN